jgi:SynChlorMet cassette protein ScmD
MKPNAKPAADPLVVLREEFDDWAVLFHPLTGEAVGTNPVGVAIWKALNGQRTLKEIAISIATQFDDAHDTVLEDTLDFVENLFRKMLVSIDNPADKE